VLSEAINPAKSTAHAGLFFHINPLHFKFLSSVYGMRQAVAAYRIITYTIRIVKTLGRIFAEKYFNLLCMKGAG
jgi:hypothetical protein